MSGADRRAASTAFLVLNSSLSIHKKRGEVECNNFGDRSDRRSRDDRRVPAFYGFYDCINSSLSLCRIQKTGAPFRNSTLFLPDFIPVGELFQISLVIIEIAVNIIIIIESKARQTALLKLLPPSLLCRTKCLSSPTKTVLSVI
jgi:hypothetical protein